MKEREIFPSFDRIERQTYVADGPIDFATWLEYSHDIDSELFRGVMIRRMAAQYPHEWISAWLFTALTNYVGVRELGKVLGSRTAVKITEIDGRLPDILFVRNDNDEIIHKDAIHGVPDLVIEIVSSNDRPSDLIPLEGDYRAFGVPEILFIDPKKKRVRCVRKTESDYEESFLTTGRLELATVPGFWIETQWLFDDNRPTAFTIAKNLIEAAEATP